MTDKKPTATTSSLRIRPRRRRTKTATETPHTELRAVGTKPQPRSKVMPPELRDDDDDLFNDMPV
jgi:hypothetical protein